MFEKGQESEDRQMKTQRRKKYRITSKFRFITSIVVMLMLAIGIFGTISGLNTSRAITKLNTFRSKSAMETHYGILPIHINPTIRIREKLSSRYAR